MYLHTMQMYKNIENNFNDTFCVDRSDKTIVKHSLNPSPKITKWDEKKIQEHLNVDGYLIFSLLKDDHPLRAKRINF